MCLETESTPWELYIAALNQSNWQVLQYLHVVAEGCVGAKQNLALLVSAVVHSGELGGQTDHVATARVRVEQTEAGLWPVQREVEGEK